MDHSRYYHFHVFIIQISKNIDGIKMAPTDFRKKIEEFKEECGPILVE